MTRRVVIFRRSDTAGVGAASHLPVPDDAGLRLAGKEATVLHTVCGLIGIGRLFDRDDATCAVCVASAGRRPGKKGKVLLRRQWEEARSGR